MRLSTRSRLGATLPRSAAVAAAPTMRYRAAELVADRGMLRSTVMPNLVLFIRVAYLWAHHPAASIWSYPSAFASSDWSELGCRARWRHSGAS